MKLPDNMQKTGITTTGATGIALMILHILGYLNGWAWPILYVLLILIAIGYESSNKVRF
jgi:fatty acid desaturase